MNNKINIRAIPQYLEEFIWKTPLDELSSLQQNFIVGLRITHLVIRDLIDGMITLRAMGLVYTTILALVPLLAVNFSVLKGFGVHNQIEPLLLNLLQPLGDKGVEITERIIAFVDNTKAGVLGTLGLVLLMYTVVSLLQKVEKSFNYTWHVTQHRPITQRFSDYLTVILIGPVLLFSALGMTASLSSMSFVQHAMEIQAIGFMFQLVARLVPYVLVISAFTFVYMLVPNIRVRFRSALIGGVVAGVLWETTSWVFASFVATSAKYTAIYSAFASMIIFFIWLYMNWLILLIGCNIASYHQQPSQRHLHTGVVRLSNRMRESLGLMIMLLVGRHYYQHKPAWSIDALAEYFRVGSQVSELLVNRLLKAKLLIATTDSPPCYVPAYDLATISLVDIMTSLRESGENDSLNPDTLHTETVVDTVYTRMEAAINTSLQGESLLDLVKQASVNQE